MIRPDRVALVHERFTELGGSERVVEQLHRAWPGSQVHAPVLDRRALPDGLVGATIHTSALQHLYRGGSSYAHLLPLLPAAMASLDLGDPDLVVTSHHAFAQRIRPPSGVRWVSYVHTPGRWLWDPVFRQLEVDDRLARAGLSAFAATQRRADRRAAQRPHRLVVNSTYVADRVRRWWGREAVVLAPPVDVDRNRPDPSVRREEFFLYMGRLVAYKRPEVAVRAAREAGVRLVVAGAGRGAEALKAAAGPDTVLLGAVSDAELLDLYQRCAALVFPGVEDFGIVPVEAQACGAPVIALGVGGVTDSVVDGVTGSLYRPRAGETDVEALTRALRTFDPAAYDPSTIRRHAETFSAAAFRARMVALCEDEALTGVSG